MLPAKRHEQLEPPCGESPTAPDEEHSSPAPEEACDACKVLEHILEMLPTKWERKEMEAGFCYSFSYQGGNFSAFTQTGTTLVHVYLPYFIQTSIEYLHQVQALCNAFNNMTLYTKVVYQVKEDDAHTLFLHLETHLRLSEWKPALQDDFSQLLASVFQGVYELRKSVADMENKEGDFKDEEAEIFSKAERDSARSTESALRDFRLTEQGDMLAAMPDRYALGDLVRRIFGTSDMAFLRLTITTESMVNLEDEESIRTFDLCRLLTDAHLEEAAEVPSGHLEEESEGTQEESPLRFVREEASAIVAMMRADGTTIRLLIFLMAESEEGGRLSMRLTAVCPQPPISDSYTADTATRQSPLSFTFLLAKPAGNPVQLRKEYEYRYREAEEARKKHQTLTNGQKLLLLHGKSTTNYNLYWGRRNFILGHYYDAISYLENEYYNVAGKHHRMGKYEQECFYDTCYYLGACYMEIGMHERAQFFFDIILDIPNPSYVCACTYNLTILKDYRLLPYINGIYNRFQELTSHSEPSMLPPTLQHFKRLLMVSHVRAFMRQDNYEEAQRWLKAMTAEGFNDTEVVELQQTVGRAMQGTRQGIAYDFTHGVAASDEILRHNPDGESNY